MLSEHMSVTIFKYLANLKVYNGPRKRSYYCYILHKHLMIWCITRIIKKYHSLILLSYTHTRTHTFSQTHTQSYFLIHTITHSFTHTKQFRTIQFHLAYSCSCHSFITFGFYSFSRLSGSLGTFDRWLELQGPHHFGTNARSSPASARARSIYSMGIKTLPLLGHTGPSVSLRSGQLLAANGAILFRSFALSS